MIERKGQMHGPLSAQDLRSYASYGSISLADPIWVVDTEEWLSAEQILIPRPIDDHASTDEPGWKQRWVSLTKKLGVHDKQSSDAPAVRRRTVRYRDYERVPVKQRAGVVLRRMVLGTLFYPPWLWSASATLFSQWVFRRKTDEHGYLKVLHPNWEVLATLLLVINAVLLVVLALWVVTDAWPFLQWCWQEVHRTLDELLQNAADGSSPST